MEVFWEKGPCTVQQVLDTLPAKPALAYNSVLTTTRILEKKGYIQHVKDGRAHVYASVLDSKEVTRSEIRHLVNRFFSNSDEMLVLNILEDRGVDQNEIDRLKQLLEGSKG